MPTQLDGSPKNPTSPRSKIGEKVHIDEVVGNNGPISLPDLADVADNVTPGKGSILAGDGSVYQEFEAGADGYVIIYDSSQPEGLNRVPMSAVSGKGVFIFGNRQIGNTTTGRYLTPGTTDSIAMTAAEEEFEIPVTGTIRNLRVRHNVPGVDAVLLTYTLLVDGIPSLLAVGMLASALSGANTSISVPVTAGQRISLLVSKAGVVSQSPRNVRVTVEIN